MSLQGCVGFLGYGNMGSAILEGLLGRGLIRANQALIYDPSPERTQAGERIGAAIADSAQAVAAAADILMLAVKPQIMDAALSGIAESRKSSGLIISIMAGISIARIQARLGGDVRVVRVMPNTPALVLAGAAGIALGPGCTDADAAAAQQIFDAVGVTEMVEEHELDAVTALSGSGPAYFFYLVESMVNAAVAEGLEPGAAMRLAAQTFHGASALLRESHESPATLRERVTSKGGTTEAALRHLREGGFESLVREAIRAAAERSRELGG